MDESNVQQQQVVSQKQQQPMVWYCCYGSNLNFDRFNVYIQGGTPKNGFHHHMGCRTKSNPRMDMFHELQHVELFFAKESPSWGGGGSAFIRQHKPVVTESVTTTTTTVASQSTVVRLYLITVDQFVDVVAQENGIHDREAIDRLEQTFQSVVLPQTAQWMAEEEESGGDSSAYHTIDFLNDSTSDPLEQQRKWYDMLVYLGSKDNYPIFSFTNYAMNHIWQEHEIPFNAPSSAYLHTIYRGLKEGKAFQEDEERYIDYFLHKVGVKGKGLDRQSIVEYIQRHK